MKNTKLMLKAIVLTQLMQSVATQRRVPTEAEAAAVNAFNVELDAADPGLADPRIDDAYPALLAAIDSLEEVL
ncbi:hypothetical protein [Burkholderia vietnamiensis]|uniref:hypothetical protein n=1 Tax=Burkholderia vietnamiensis TaxID=60552 RepID=UPI00264EB60C|nr:hypothetical protein [Burkholderia vietnamiensis]MDN8037430.1 hypothetical protein [Burkholderia vietnamiensis]